MQLYVIIFDFSNHSGDRNPVTVQDVNGTVIFYG